MARQAQAGAENLARSVISAADIGWVAGFLEGEGWFGLARGTAQIRATQVQKQPLERLRGLVGGSLYLRRHKPPRSDAWEWGLCGKGAIGLLMTIWWAMSPKRRERMSQIIDFWESGPGRGWHRQLTECRYGHPFTATEIRITGKGQQVCLDCRHIRNEMRRELRHRHCLTFEERQASSRYALAIRWHGRSA